MDWRDAALAIAGLIGSCTAVLHGILVQRLMVRPIGSALLGNAKISATIRKLVPLLLHFSTVSWFLGGIALIAAAAWFNDAFKFATGLFVGSLYFFGAVANAWGSRGRHPGWMLMAAAVILITVGVCR